MRRWFVSKVNILKVENQHVSIWKTKEFLTTDLREGGIYIVLVDMILAFSSTHVGLTPVTAADTKSFGRAKELVLSEAPLDIPEDEATVEKMNDKLQKFITKQLGVYEKEKSERKFRHISPEMAVDIGLLN